MSIKKAEIPPNIRLLGKQLKRLQDQAKRLGIFCNDRELLSCPHCGLMEDVAVRGRLITVRDVEAGIDTGLRFPEPDEKGVSCCPGCGGKVEYLAGL